MNHQHAMSEKKIERHSKPLFYIALRAAKNNNNNKKQNETIFLFYFLRTEAVIVWWSKTRHTETYLCIYLKMQKKGKGKETSKHNYNLLTKKKTLRGMAADWVGFFYFYFIYYVYIFEFERKQKLPRVLIPSQPTCDHVELVIHEFQGLVGPQGHCKAPLIGIGLKNKGKVAWENYSFVILLAWVSILNAISSN